MQYVVGSVYKHEQKSFCPKFIKNFENTIYTTLMLKVVLPRKRKQEDKAEHTLSRSVCKRRSLMFTQQVCISVCLISHL